MYSRVVLRFVLVIWLSLQWYGSSAFAQTEAGEIAKVRSSRGYIKTDGDGHATAMLLNGWTNEKIEAIDFSVFSHLDMLILSGGKITGRAITHLCGLPAGLDCLHISLIPIGDEALLPLLKKQTSLGWLLLSETKITDRTLLEMGPHLQMRTLEVNWTDITDKSLAKLETLTPNLGTLRLGHTKVTDEGMRTIKNLRHITFFDLHGTAVTDEGILELGACQLLLTLCVRQTKVTEKGKNAIRALHPYMFFE